MTDERPEEELEEFLSAPETLQGEELQKAKLRKAREEAKTKQLAAMKRYRDVEPSTEDLIADMIRVAEDPITNPLYHEFRATSRRRYELYGWYPVIHLDKKWGQFEHAKQVCGLADEPGTRLWRASRAQASRNEHIGRYVRRYVWPHVLQPQVELSRPLLMLTISDTHATFLDPFTWHCFLSAIRDLRPGIVYLNGDILEGAEISRHPKIPGWTIPLQQEFDFAKEMFRQIREVHEGHLWWGAGNHGLDRIASYLTQVAPALACLDSMRFDKLVDLAGLDVRLAQSGTIASPREQEDFKAGLLLFGFYRIHHGTKLGQMPALAELRDAMYSGQSGHVHRAAVAYGTTERMQGLNWMSTPMGCTERAARAYIKGTNTGWQKGFGVCWLFPDGKVHQYPVITDGDRCYVEGYQYDRNPELLDPDVSTNWLKEVPLP